MKVLLINPPYREKASVTKMNDSKYIEPPLGIMYISSYVKKYLPKVEIEILDANLLYETTEESIDEVYTNIIDKIKSFKPDIVGLSSLYYANSIIVHNLANIIKYFYKNIVIVVAGSYPTFMPYEVMENRNIDFVVLSEGEKVFHNLLSALSEGKSLEGIKGLIYRDSEGKVRGDVTQKDFIEDLSKLPFPDRDAVPIEKYFKGRNVLYRFYAPNEIKIGSLTATRGCPYECTFCGSKQFWGRRIRVRDPKDVIDEMVFMNQKYNINAFAFNDDNFTFGRARFHHFMDEIENRLPKVIWCSGGGISVRAINDEKTIQRMYETGIAYFNLAIESGSDETLKKIKKPVTIEEVRNVVRLIRKYGDKPIHGFFIVGFPFETMEDMQKTWDFAKELQLDWTCLYCLQPFPASEIYDECLKKGLIDKFDTGYGELFRPSNIKYGGFTSEQLSQWNYDKNIELNFVNNPNILKNPYQAIRDFTYVISIAPDHLIAYYMRGKCYEIIGNKKKASDDFLFVKNNISENNIFYKYFKKYNLVV